MSQPTATWNDLSAERRSVLQRALDAQAEPFTTVAQTVRIAAGHVLVQEGVSQDVLYLMLEGELIASRQVGGETVRFGAVGPGEWIGEVSVIDQGPSTATVTASTECELLALSHEGLVALQTERPEVAGAVLNNVTKGLAGRLRRTTAAMSDAVNSSDAPPSGTWNQARHRLVAGLQEAA